MAETRDNGDAMEAATEAAMQVFDARIAGDQTWRDHLRRMIEAAIDEYTRRTGESDAR